MRRSRSLEANARAVNRLIGWLAQKNGQRALLEDTWGYRRTWMVGKVRNTTERGLPVRTWTDKYLTALSLGPWQVQRQLQQKNRLLSRVGGTEWSALSPRAVAALPFSLAWQRHQAMTLHQNLRNLDWTLDDLCRRLLRLSSGEGAYAVLAILSGVKSYSKCLDFFVREGLRLDTIPVDRHVGRLLNRFNLRDVARGELVSLLREAGVKPRFAARAMYEQGLR